MGIITRFKDIMAANINALLDKCEDPEKMIDQYLRNLESDLGKVKAETASVMADEKRAKRELDECNAEITKFQNYAVKAVEAVDACVGKAVDALLEVDGQMFICADHGNAEQLVDYETGDPFTAHTTNPVPFILVNADPAYKLSEGGCLADIAPTLIELMGMEQPKEMTGKSLLVK